MTIKSKEKLVVFLTAIVAVFLATGIGFRYCPALAGDKAANVLVPNDGGFRVLILYNSDDLGHMPTTQLSILTSGDIRAYLRSRCVAGKDGKTPEYRIFDTKTDISREADVWKSAAKLASETPWIVILNGNSGTSCKLPTTAAATLDLLKQYGK